MNMHISIRELRQEDEDIWKQMAVAYHPDTAKHINVDWARLIGGEAGSLCFIAEGNGKVAGFVNVIQHDFIFRRRPCVYLADLFVIPPLRRIGVATALIRHVLDYAKGIGAGRVYWMTYEYNEAHVLYDKIAGKSDFVRYEVDF